MIVDENNSMRSDFADLAHGSSPPGLSESKPTLSQAHITAEDLKLTTRSLKIAR